MPHTADSSGYFSGDNAYETGLVKSCDDAETQKKVASYQEDVDATFATNDKEWNMKWD